jgi:hypothetical protein
MKYLSVSLFVVVIAAASFLGAGDASAQKKRGGIGVSLDSLAKLEMSADSLIHHDTTSRKPAAKPKQLANYRAIDLTNDGQPEEMRLIGEVVPETDKIKFDFTIKQNGKLMFKDTWTAAGYFDPADKLNDSTRFARLRRVVHLFFANENFLVLDSARYSKLLAESSPAEVAIDSPESRELLSGDRIMYSVFASRDNFYGLMWLPSKKKFVKAWQN